MKYFKAGDGQVYGYEPGDQDDLIDQAVKAGWADVSGSWPPPLAPAERLAAELSAFENALEAHLDAVAKAHRYNDRITFALRAGYAGPYQAEGAAYARWMDECNVLAFAVLQDVRSGKKELPELDDFIGALPPFVLPDAA